MNIIERIIDALRRLFGWRPEPPVVDPPVVVEPVEPQEPAEPEPDPEEPDEPEDPDVPEDPDDPAGPSIIVFAPPPDRHWQLVTDPLASPGGALEAAESGDNEGTLTALAPLIVYEGRYALWVRAFGADGRSDAFYAGIAGGVAHRRFPAVHGRYQWIKVDEYDLVDGDYYVGVGVGEIGARIDCLVLDPTGLTPPELEVLVGAPPHIEPEPEPDPDPGPDPDPEPEPELPGDYSDATHRVAPLVDPRFDPARVTLRTGETLDADQRYFYDAFTRAFLRSDPSTYTNARTRIGSKSTYYMGRYGQSIQVPAIMAASRTGDGRILDLLTVSWNLAFKQLVTPFDATNLSWTYIKDEGRAGAKIVDGKWVLVSGKAPWSPYRKWLYRGDAGSAGAGTDLNTLQTIKPWAILLQYLWMLEVNRDAKSPAGFDYGAEADKWRDVVAGFIASWSIASDEPWAINYAGLDGGMRRPDGSYLFGTYRTRAKPGQWPFFVRNEGHAIYNSALFCYYASLLGDRGWPIPNHKAAMAGADMLMEYIRDSKWVESKDSNGRPCIIFKGGSTHSAMKATYTNYAALEWQHIIDIGRWDHIFTPERRVMVARAYADMIQSDGSTLGDLASEVDRAGHGLEIKHGSRRTSFQNAINGFSAPLLWETGTYLFQTASEAQSVREAGGYGLNAKTHILPALQFVSLVE